MVPFISAVPFSMRTFCILMYMGSDIERDGREEGEGDGRMGKKGRKRKRGRKREEGNWKLPIAGN